MIMALGRLETLVVLGTMLAFSASMSLNSRQVPNQKYVCYLDFATCQQQNYQNCVYQKQQLTNTDPYISKEMLNDPRMFSQLTSSNLDGFCRDANVPFTCEYGISEDNTVGLLCTLETIISVRPENVANKAPMTSGAMYSEPLDQRTLPNGPTVVPPNDGPESNYVWKGGLVPINQRILEILQQLIKHFRPELFTKEQNGAQN